MDENWQTGELLEKVLTHGLGTRAAAAGRRDRPRRRRLRAAYAALDAGRPRRRRCSGLSRGPRRSV